jgi:ankyrin repeat protein
MDAARYLPFLALLAAILAPAVQAQAQGFSNVPRPAAPEERPLSPLQIQRDAFSGAIAKNDPRKVAEFIRGGVALDFNFDEELRGRRSSESPLTMAAFRGHFEIAQMLLEAGADVRRKDGSGNNAISAARTPEMVQLLIKHGADPNAPGRYDETPVAKAAEGGNFAVLDALLAGGARFDASSRPPDLFTRVVEAGKPELIAGLLQRGADPRSPPTKALWPLIEKGDAANARLLIQGGADPNAFDGRERVVLRALFRKQWEIAEALLDAGASLKIAESPGCENGAACESIQAARYATFNPPFLLKLKARGLDLDTVSTTTGHTALTSLIVEQTFAIMAVSGGTAIGVAVGPGGQQMTTQAQRPVTSQVIPPPDNAARMKALLDAGADPNRKLRQFTPLMVAAGRNDKPAMIDVLMAGGGRIDFDGTIPPLKSSDDPAGAIALPPGGGGILVGTGSIERLLGTSNYQGVRTGMRVGPLGWAVLSGRPDIAQRLLERDGKIEAADRNLLYFAAAAGDWDFALAALRHTREVNVANRADVTPLMLAAGAGRADVVRALLAARADVNARSARIWPPLTERNIRDELGNQLGAFAGHSPPKPDLVGGYTALGAAKESGNAEVVRILSEAGGRE